MSDATDQAERDDPDRTETEDTSAVEDFAMADVSAQTWFKLMQKFVEARYPAMMNDAGVEFVTRDGIANIVVAAERDCLVACFDAMASMARKFNPPEDGPSIVFDFSRIGKG